MSTNPEQVRSISGRPSLPVSDQDAVMAAIAGIRQKLPFLTTLTAAERNGLAKVGDKSVGFVNKAVDVAAQNPGILPASHSLDDVRNTAQLFQGMEGIKLALGQLQKQVNDTTIKLGSDAYALARTIYAATKSPIAPTHLITAADTLGKQFRRKPRGAAARSESNAANGSSPAAASSATASPAPTTTQV